MKHVARGSQYPAMISIASEPAVVVFRDVPKIERPTALTASTITATARGGARLFSCAGLFRQRAVGCDERLRVLPSRQQW